MNLLRAIRNTFRAQAAIAPNATCPACGKRFACGASLRGCWCSEVKLSDAARDELRQLYSGCLCRACLERAAEKARNGTADERRSTQMNEDTPK